MQQKSQENVLKDMSSFPSLVTVINEICLRLTQTLRRYMIAWCWKTTPDKEQRTAETAFPIDSQEPKAQALGPNS